MQALQDFGLSSLGVAAADLLQIGTWLQFGVRPYRIDLLNSITGVDTEEAWRDRISTKLDGIPICVIDRQTLIRNKRSTGRPKDLIDVQRLEEE